MTASSELKFRIMFQMIVTKDMLYQRLLLSWDPMDPKIRARVHSQNNLTIGLMASLSLVFSKKNKFSLL